MYPYHLTERGYEKVAPGRYRITIEGVVGGDGRFRYSGGEFASPRMAHFERRGLIERLPDPAPEWRPGDVIVVKFHPFGEPYTYVRGRGGWPGDLGRARTDAEITELWREGKVTPVLQSGGEPFDANRVPS